MRSIGSAPRLLLSRFVSCVASSGDCHLTDAHVPFAFIAHSNCLVLDDLQSCLEGGDYGEGRIRRP